MFLNPPDLFDLVDSDPTGLPSLCLKKAQVILSGFVVNTAMSKIYALVTITP